MWVSLHTVCATKPRSYPLCSKLSTVTSQRHRPRSGKSGQGGGSKHQRRYVNAAWSVYWMVRARRPVRAFNSLWVDLFLVACQAGSCFGNSVVIWYTSGWVAGFAASVRKPRVALRHFHMPHRVAPWITCQGRPNYSRFVCVCVCDFFFTSLFVVWANPTKTVGTNWFSKALVQHRGETQERLNDSKQVSMAETHGCPVTLWLLRRLSRAGLYHTDMLRAFK